MHDTFTAFLNIPASKTTRCLYRGTWHKANLAVQNSARGRGWRDWMKQNFKISLEEKLNFTKPMVLFKYTSTHLLQNYNRSCRLKYKCVLFSVTQEGRKRLNTTVLALAPLVSHVSTDLFGPMLCGFAWEEPGTGEQKGWATETLWLQLQTSESEFPDKCIVHGVSYSNTKWKGGKRGRHTEVTVISLDNIHTLIYILTFLYEHKDTEARMLLISSNLSNFPEWY